MWRLRPAETFDRAILERALYEAAFWRGGGARPSRRQALADPRLRRYVEGWGRSGDAGVIADDAASGSIGAAWYRLFRAEESGYGFVDEATPELGIAVLPGYRRRGIGRGLLSELIRMARAAGFGALSLSVARDNPAVELYERAGFRTVGVVGESWTMLAELRTWA